MTHWVRFTSADGTPGMGALEGGQIAEYRGSSFADAVATGRRLALADVRLAAPCTPTKVVALWNNFRALGEKLGKPAPLHPLFLIKPATSVIGPGAAIRRPARYTGKIVFEGELGIVIGKVCADVSLADAPGFILGYTCVNDVTARDLQNKDGQWSRAKGFDTFCPIGPVVAAGLDPWGGVRVRTHVNGELRQDGTTADFIFPLDVVMRYITQVMTLEPGDVIATGTPAGVSPLQAGDTVAVSVEGVGTLSNPVADAS